MATVNFTQLFDNLKVGVVDLAKKSSKDYIAEATTDGQSLLDSMKDDLEKWVAALAVKKLSQEEFEDLVLGQKDTLEMVSLKQAGLLEIKADQFKSDVLNLVINTVTAVI